MKSRGELLGKSGRTNGGVPQDGLLVGVPGCRPPRRSPGFEPLGICYFANFWDGPELTNVKDVNAGLSPQAAQL